MDQLASYSLVDQLATALHLQVFYRFSWYKSASILLLFMDQLASYSLVDASRFVFLI